jgi:hypothetical protein
MSHVSVKRFWVPFAAIAVVLALTCGVAVAQTRPAIVKNVDEPGRIPYQQFVSATPGPASACGLNFCTWFFPNVPAGKRLVITDFFGTVSLQPTGRVHSLRLNVWDRTNPVNWVLKNSFEVPPNPSAYYDVALTFQLERYPFQAKPTMFVDAGLSISIDFWTGTALLNSDWPSQMTLVGYLVDLTY